MLKGLNVKNDHSNFKIILSDKLVSRAVFIETTPTFDNKTMSSTCLFSCTSEKDDRK